MTQIRTGLVGGIPSVLHGTLNDNLSAKGADIASATTLNLNLASGDLIDVTGTTTVTAITLDEGLTRTVRFTGALTLTNGASLVTGTGANITTAAGDFAVIRGYASGVVRIMNYQPAVSGVWVTKLITFTEDATSTTHTGSVVVPAGSILHGIQVTSSVLWTGGTATMKVGDAVDDDGYFTGVNLKATDLLVGEVLDTRDGDCWGGKEGVYLTSAGRRGAVATNFGPYLAAGTTITGVVTVGTPATTAGRTFMAVTYSQGGVVAATAA